MANKQITQIMTADPTGQELVRFSDNLARTLVRDRLKNTQIRNIFTEVRKIEAMYGQDPTAAIRRLTMLKPKLAYQAKRHREISKLKDALIDAIDVVVGLPAGEKQAQAFERFIDFFEAILAYHKANGGQN